MTLCSSVACTCVHESVLVCSHDCMNMESEVKSGFMMEEGVSQKLIIDPPPPQKTFPPEPCICSEI